MPARRASFISVVFLVAALAAGGARADLGQPIVLVDYCKSAEASQTLILGKDTAYVETAGWAPSSLCGRLVVDVVVPSNAASASLGSKFFLWAGMPLSDGYPWAGQFYYFGSSSDPCALYHGSLRVYAKWSSESEFHWIGGGTTHGIDDPFGRCWYVEDPGFVDLPADLGPPLYGSTTYRIAFTARIGTQNQQVRIGAYRAALIP